MLTFPQNSREFPKGDSIECFIVVVFEYWKECINHVPNSFFTFSNGLWVTPKPRCTHHSTTTPQAIITAVTVTPAVSVIQVVVTV
jgi:hypothetical protein